MSKLEKYLDKRHAYLKVAGFMDVNKEREKELHDVCVELLNKQIGKSLISYAYRDTYRFQIANSTVTIKIEFGTITSWSHRSSYDVRCSSLFDLDIILIENVNGVCQSMCYDILHTLLCSNALMNY